MNRKKLIYTASGGVKIRTWQLRDEFSVAEAAPIATPHLADFVGSFTAVQNDGSFATIGGELVVTPQVTPSLTDLLIYSGNIARAAGVAFLFGMTIADVTKVCTAFLSSDGTWNNKIHYIFGNGGLLQFSSSAGNYALRTIANGVTLKLILVLRSTGVFVVVDDKLLFVSALSSAANVVATILGYTDATKYQNIRAAQLGGAWLNTYGPGAVTAGVIAAGTTFSHAANCLIYCTATANGSAGATVWKFRQQDADNYWRLTINADGSADLSEVVATVATSRGTAAAGVFADGERFSIQANGSTIRINDAAGTVISYASATNFQTATAGELTSLATDAVMTTLEIYPVDLSGKDLAWIRALEVAA